jgi:capsular exopolysaccharide family
MEKVTFLKREKLDYRANESYKTLRTNIQFCGNEVKVLTFTSCTPNEGKSSVSFNLAVSFAEAGKKVILIDADLRKSVLIGRYKVGEINFGLTHYLSGQKELQEVLCNTDVENMDIIFSGSYSPNPAELLNHSRFGNMISKLREEYDYVIIDTPPLGSVIDSAIVAKISDGAIIVIEANAISYKFAQSVKDQLDKSNCRILGAVINKIPMEKKGYYGKYYGRYYGKYYGKYYGTYGDKKHKENSTENDQKENLKKVEKKKSSNMSMCNKIS